MNSSQSEINLSPYIKKLLKQINPKSGIGNNPLSQLNTFINILATRISEKASFLTNHEIVKSRIIPKKKASTCNYRAIQAAVRLIVPGELSKHSVSEGKKAITKYSQFIHSRKKSKTKSKTKSKPITKASKAGLKFSVTRVHKILTFHHKGRVNIEASVYLTAVLEYIAAEFLELAIISARANKRLKRISIRDFQIATLNDDELYKLTAYLKWVWVGGGVLENIHPFLM